MDILQKRLLLLMHIPVLIPQWVPEHLALVDCSANSRGDSAPSYRLVYSDGHESVLLVEATSGGGLGDVFPGEHTAIAKHPTLGDGAVEFYAPDSDEGLEFRTQWLTWGAKGTYYGVAGANIGEEAALKVIESLAPLE